MVRKSFDPVEVMIPEATMRRKARVRISHWPILQVPVLVWGGWMFGYVGFRISSEFRFAWPIPAGLSTICLIGALVCPRVVVRVDRIRQELAWSRTIWWLPAINVRRITLSELARIVLTRRFHRRYRSDMRKFRIEAILRNGTSVSLFTTNHMPWMKPTTAARRIAEVCGCPGRYVEFDVYQDFMSETVLYNPSPTIPTSPIPVIVPPEFGSPPSVD